MIPRASRRTWTCTLSIAVGLLCGACNNPGGKGEGGPTQIPARKNPYVLDIPVPEGFKLNEGKSSNKSLPTVRWVDHTYEGGKDPMAVRNFYVISMPTQAWQVMSDTANEGVYT